MRIDSGGSVGIGTNSSTDLISKLSVLNDVSIITQVSSPNNTDGGAIYLGATGGTGSSTQAKIQAHREGNQDTGELSFSVATGSDIEEVMRLDSGGHLLAPNGITLGRAVGSYAAANTLDDYEEGLWTPLLVPQTGAFTSQTIINFLTDKPRYTKIGNLVMVSVLFTTYELTKGTASGDVYLGGLPFEVYTSSVATITISHDFLGDNPSSGSVGYQGDKIALLYRTSPNGEDVNLQVSDLGTTDGSNTFKLTLVYRTNE
jgi:hypothetical protein